MRHFGPVFDHRMNRRVEHEFDQASAFTGAHHAEQLGRRRVQLQDRPMAIRRDCGIGRVLFQRIFHRFPDRRHVFRIPIALRVACGKAGLSQQLIAHR